MPESFSGLNLYVHGQGRREAVQVKLLRRFTFRFQEKLVLFLVGEGYDFGFYTGAIAGPYALNLPVEKGRIRQSFTKERCVSSLVKQVQHGSCFRWRTPLFIRRIYGRRFLLPESPYLRNARSVRRCVRGFPFSFVRI